MLAYRYVKDVSSATVCSKKGGILYLHYNGSSHWWPIERPESTDLHTGNCHNRWIYMGMGNMSIDFKKLKLSIFMEGGLQFSRITPQSTTRWSGKQSYMSCQKIVTWAWLGSFEIRLILLLEAANWQCNILHLYSPHIAQIDNMAGVCSMEHMFLTV